MLQYDSHDYEDSDTDIVSAAREVYFNHDYTTSERNLHAKVWGIERIAHQILDLDGKVIWENFWKNDQTFCRDVMEKVVQRKVNGALSGDDKKYRVDHSQQTRIMKKERKRKNEKKRKREKKRKNEEKRKSEKKKSKDEKKRKNEKKTKKKKNDKNEQKDKKEQKGNAVRKHQKKGDEDKIKKKDKKKKANKEKQMNVDNDNLQQKKSKKKSNNSKDKNRKEEVDDDALTSLKSSEEDQFSFRDSDDATKDNDSADVYYVMDEPSMGTQNGIQEKHTKNHKNTNLKRMGVDGNDAVVLITSSEDEDFAVDDMDIDDLAIDQVECGGNISAKINWTTKNKKTRSALNRLIVDGGIGWTYLSSPAEDEKEFEKEAAKHWDTIHEDVRAILDRIGEDGFKKFLKMNKHTLKGIPAILHYALGQTSLGHGPINNPMCQWLSSTFDIHIETVDPMTSIHESYDSQVGREASSGLYSI